MDVNIPIIVLGAVFVLIMVRNVGRFRLQIWHIMAGGAAAVLLLGQISPRDAVLAVNLDVMVFLLGMFVVGKALEESGYLEHLAYKYFRRAATVDGLVLLILFFTGFMSALLLNDTLAVVGTPVMVFFAARHRASPKLLILALAFAVTIGSVMSPIGNPQNLLIAIHGGESGVMKYPFVTFMQYLFIPTVVNLFLAYAVLKLMFPAEFHRRPLVHRDAKLRDPALARLCKASLWVLLVMIAAKIAVTFAGDALFGHTVDFRLTYIALAACAPILLASPRRIEVLRGIDWPTLVFFAAMFVLMEAVWLSGFFQDLMAAWSLNPGRMPVILGSSVVLSQFMSNVPFTALYLPLLDGAGTASAAQLAALAAGATIAGNLTILGAASNVIIVQSAERRGHIITFWDFLRVGAPLTALNVAVYWAYLAAVG